MKDLIRPIIDVSVAILLVVALGVVFRYDKAPEVAAAPEAELKPVEGGQDEIPPPVQPLKLAVTYCPGDRAEYDDMGRLLKQLGQGYEYTRIHMDDLADAEKLARYDVVFATCGTYPRAWLEEAEQGAGGRPGTTRHLINREMFDRARDSLRKFVSSGKTLYVSDQLYAVLGWAFPEFAVPGSMGESGLDRQTVQARVVDPGLSEQIGQEIELKFDLPNWCPARFEASDETVYLEGQFRGPDGDRQSAPLLVKIPFEQGSILFTSFHNEKQNSDQERQLLKYLVFATVTAKEESRVARTMLAGGFSPRKSSLLSASSSSPSVTRTFANARRGHLRFVLGFENRGARLRLSVAGPDGKTQTEEGTSTLTIDVKDAAVGDWKYTVTALSVPFENFPFTMTVGEE